jgi:hypothetical protein
MVKRIVWFIIMLAAGAALGLLYGWVIHPGDASSSPLSSLRRDYQTEMVLMAAEVFHKDGNVNSAAEHLSRLGDRSPAVIAAQAAESARTSGYSIDDLNLMNAMTEALKALPDSSGGAP